MRLGPGKAGSKWRYARKPMHRFGNKIHKDPPQADAGLHQLSLAHHQQPFICIGHHPAPLDLQEEGGVQERRKAELQQGACCGQNRHAPPACMRRVRNGHPECIALPSPAWFALTMAVTRPRAVEATASGALLLALAMPATAPPTPAAAAPMRLGSMLFQL